MRLDLTLENWIIIGEETRCLNRFLSFGESICYDFPNTMDCREYEAIAFDIFLPAKCEAEFNIILHPLKIARPEFFSKTEARICVHGEGKSHVEVAFRQFDYQKMVGAFLKYISSIEVCCTAKEGLTGSCKGITLLNICMKKIGNFHISSEILSQAGDCDKPVPYEITLENDTQKEMHVGLAQEKYARETMILDYPDKIILPPQGKKTVIVKVMMTELVPPGGYEKAILRAVPNGNSAKSRTITLVTSRKRQHPFLIHKEEGWQKVRDKIKRSKEAQAIFENSYCKTAEEWEVPVPGSSNTYVYPAYSQNALGDTAIAWKLSGKEAYAKKCAEYLKGMVDGTYGYMTTNYSYFQFVESEKEYDKGDHKVRRACSAGWVQEAEFFIGLTSVYDLLYDSGYLDDEIHRGMEQIYRNYMEFAGWRLTDGDGNNFQLAEMTAGLFCAYILQDYHWIDRFINGENGFCDLLSSVLYDDGVYFEEASGYMRLAAELLFTAANGSQNFGINLKDMQVPACYDRYILHSPWAMRETWSEDGKPFLGMGFQRYQPVANPVRSIKQYYDALLLLINHKGILMSMNDGNELYLYEIFEQAYDMYRDERYGAVIMQAPHRSLIYGVQKLPDTGYQLGSGSLLLPAAGFGILRGEESWKENTYKSQAVLKFGPHGGYHGHFDRLSLLSFIKEDCTFHNMEYTWYGYTSFLFKMWVQTSVAHNMVTADLRMQEPASCEPVLYYSGKGYQAVCAQTVSRWCDPPYGGQTPYPIQFPGEKCGKEGKYVLNPGAVRRQGETGEYSEPVFQRRLLILTEGYCIIWDYEKSDKEHDFDCLYHPKGVVGMNNGNLSETTERLNIDPFGAGQFVTNCYWYHADGTAHLHFDNSEDNHDRQGILKAPAYCDIYRVFPREGQVIIGKFPAKEDSFTAEDIQSGINHMSSCTKKTVSFRVRGMEARFVTVLEMGETAGKIKRIDGAFYNQITVEHKDGRVRQFTVTGMDQADRKQVGIRMREYYNGELTGEESAEGFPV